MAMTVSEAIALVRRKVNDPDSVKYDTNTEIEEALEGALESTIKEVVGKGRRTLEEVITGTAAAGVIDLSTYKPLFIHTINIVEGEAYHSISRIPLDEAGAKVTDSRAFQIALTRDFALSSTGGDPLLTNSRTDRSLERLICFRAAEELLVDEHSESDPLARSIARYERAVMGYPGVSVHAAMSGFNGDRARGIGWTYNPATYAVQLWHRR